MAKPDLLSCVHMYTAATARLPEGSNHHLNLDFDKLSKSRFPVKPWPTVALGGFLGAKLVPVLDEFVIVHDRVDFHHPENVDEGAHSRIAAKATLRIDLSAKAMDRHIGIAISKFANIKITKYSRIWIV